MLKEIIVLVIVVYIISRVLRFVLPIFRITSVANDHMRRMQEQTKEMNSRMNQNQPPVQPVQNRKTEKEGDYIDYEEIK